MDALRKSRSQEARVSLGCASSNSYASIVLSKLPAMNKFLISTTWKRIVISLIQHLIKLFTDYNMMSRNESDSVPMLDVYLS